MIKAFDRIQIAVPGLAEAGAQYRALLGVKPLPSGSGDAPGLLFPLANTAIELVESAGEPPLIRGVVLDAPDAGNLDMPLANARGLGICLGNGSLTAALRERHKRAGEGCPWVDHLVLRTADATQCIELFGKRLGLRLALDQTVPEWGGRMLFFRTGKVTLEVIESERDKPAADYFWGIAYQCRDLDQTSRLLAGRG